MSSLTTFRALIPEFAAVVDATVSVYLSVATLQHNTTSWGAMFETAMVYFAAHLMSLDPTLGTSGASGLGPIKSQKDGDLSRSYGTIAAASGSTAADEELSQTMYGRRFLQIRGTRAAVSAFYSVLPV